MKNKKHLKGYFKGYFKDYFIRFTAGDQDSCQKAIDRAEELGYREWKFLKVKPNDWILELDSEWRYNTTEYPEPYLMDNLEKEIKVFEPMEMIYVSDISQEDALLCKNKHLHLYTVHWDTIDKYLCVASWDELAFLAQRKFHTLLWGYAVKIDESEKKTYSKKELLERTELMDLKPFDAETN